MKKREYKVKFENGLIKPLEPLNIQNEQEGIVIFMDETEDTNLMNASKIESFKSIVGILSDLSNEQKEIFEQALVRESWRNE